MAATSIPHAMELCIDHAREKHNRSVDRIADLMGLASKFTLYKYVESGRLPTISIRPFEHACDRDFVTRYLAHSDGKLLIDVPVGRSADVEDVQYLQQSCTAAVAALIDFRRGTKNADDTIAALFHAMEDLAWHRVNVQKHAQPELEFSK